MSPFYCPSLPFAADAHSATLRAAEARRKLQQQQKLEERRKYTLHHDRKAMMVTMRFISVFNTQLSMCRLGTQLTAARSTVQQRNTAQ
jgi:hypothetical protein